MVAHKITGSGAIMRMPQPMFAKLQAHLFPGDHDEHGAVIEAGLATVEGKAILLARNLHLAEDGVDWLPGKRGYRMLPAAYVTKRIRECRDERLVYLAVHNHSGRGGVTFSGTDLDTHERGFPALLDVAKGMPVGGLVFAEDCVAGDLWMPNGKRHALDKLDVIGLRRTTLASTSAAQHASSNPIYHRQTLLFGHRGQALLASARVAIIGLGGVGILLAQMLGRLGVGSFVLIDPDKLEVINLPRMVEAHSWEAMGWLTRDRNPEWLRTLGFRLATSKVRLAKRIIRKANRCADVGSFESRFENKEALEAVKACDFIFLAADSHRARLLFNALVHQHLIPGVQLGSRVRSDRLSGEIEHVHSNVRTVLPHTGCLVCNQAINAARLNEESISPAMRNRQKYVDDPDVAAPSVITLNALSASQATNDFLFYITGLAQDDGFCGYVRNHPMIRRIEMLSPRRDQACLECGVESASRFARGDGVALPLVG